MLRNFLSVAKMASLVYERENCSVETAQYELEIIFTQNAISRLSTQYLLAILSELYLSLHVRIFVESLEVFNYIESVYDRKNYFCLFGRRFSF